MNWTCGELLSGLSWADAQSLKLMPHKLDPLTTHSYDHGRSSILPDTEMDFQVRYYGGNAVWRCGPSLDILSRPWEDPETSSG